MGDALEAFSSPFRPVNKQLRKLEGSIRLYRLLGPLPGGGCKGLRWCDLRKLLFLSCGIAAFYKTKRFAVFRNRLVIPVRFSVFLCSSVRCLYVFRCGVAVLAPSSSLPPPPHPHPFTKNERATNRILIVKKKPRPSLVNWLHLFRLVLFVQMFCNFSKGEFLNTVSKIQEKKKEVAFLCSRPPKNVINKALSRRSRATTAEECTKKCDEWTKSLCR